MGGKSIFIDDQFKNIRGAETVGIRGIYLDIRNPDIAFDMARAARPEASRLTDQDRQNGSRWISDFRGPCEFLYFPSYNLISPKGRQKVTCAIRIPAKSRIGSVAYS
jgi:hypothetical protein